MKKIKVLHVYKTYYPDTNGGIEMVMQQLTEGLKDLHVESRILVLSKNPSPKKYLYKDIEVIRCKTTLELASNPMALSAFSEFRAQLKWADIVHYQFPWPFADLLHIFSNTKKPSVISYQSDIVRQKFFMRLYKPFMNVFLKRADWICASSPQYIKTSEVLSKISHKVSAIPNGIQESACPQASRHLISEWERKLGRGFFLFIGVLRYYKGLKDLVAAASLSGLPVVIAGAGPEREALEAQAQSLNASNIIFTGSISDEVKSALLELCHAFVFPSHLRSEAFGMSLVEASIYAKPLITCEIGTGTTYVNEKWVTGLVVPPNDPQALASAMQQLDNDPSLSKQMGQAARARYETLFTGSAMAKSYRDIYESILLEK